VARFLTKSLTMGWPHKCVYYSKGVTREVSEFFEVRAQVDRDLTTVSCFDRLLGLIKNPGRHSLPPLNGISSRDSIR
jgi:hypothetical protein